MADFRRHPEGARYSLESRKKLYGFFVSYRKRHPELNLDFEKYIKLYEEIIAEPLPMKKSRTKITWLK